MPHIARSEFCPKVLRIAVSAQVHTRTWMVGDGRRRVPETLEFSDFMFQHIVADVFNGFVKNLQTLAHSKLASSTFHANDYSMHASSCVCWYLLLTNAKLKLMAFVVGHTRPRQWWCRPPKICVVAAATLAARYLLSGHIHLFGSKPTMKYTDIIIKRRLRHCPTPKPRSRAHTIHFAFILRGALLLHLIIASHVSIAG